MIRNIPFVFVLLLGLVSCAEEKEEATIEADQPLFEDVNPPPAISIDKTELAYYQEAMSRNSFRGYPAIECTPLNVGAIPQMTGSVLSNVDVKVQVHIEEKVLGSPPNFNCKYHVVYWVCGENCKQVAVFDSETGKPVKVFDTAFGAIFSPKSRMLILNPPQNVAMNIENRKALGEPAFWELSTNGFQQRN